MPSSKQFPTNSWREALPWLTLTRTPALALRGRVMLLAAVGLLAVWGGDVLLSGGAAKPQAAGDWVASDLPIASWQHLSAAWVAFAEPFVEVAEGSRIGPNVARILWRIAVWGLLGGAILRIAALALTRGEALSATSALRFAWRNRAGSLGGPLMLVMGLAIVAAPLGLIRLAMQVDWLAPVGAAIWPLAMLAAAVAAFYALGMAIGWPIVCAATATDQSDSFDAISRMFAYVYQKPLRIAGYVAVVLALGLLAGMAIEVFLAAVLYASNWSLGPGVPESAAIMVAWWETALVALTSVFFTAYLWTSAAGIYLLRRQDIDEVLLDEVYLEPSACDGEKQESRKGTTGEPTSDTEQAA